MSSGTEVDGRRQAKPGTRRQRRTRAAGRTPTAQPRRTASLAASRPKGGAPRHQEDRQPRGRPPSTGPSGCHGGPPAAGPHPRCGGPERGAERRSTWGNGRGLGVGARQRWWGATLTQGAWRLQCAGLGRPGIHPLVCAAVRHRICGMSHGSTVVCRSRICPGGHAKVDPGREGCPRSRSSTRRNSWRRRQPSRRLRASLRSVCCAALAMCPHR